MSESILLVEDNENLLRLLTSYLSKSGFNVFYSTTAGDALEIFNNNHIDLIVLDLMLPDLSGEDFSVIIREKSDVPIIMLTAKVSLDSKIKGLSLGADDYMTKPFSNKELLLRIKALLKRYKPMNSRDKILVKDNLLLYPLESRLEKDGREVSLTGNEFKLLKALVENPNIVLSRDQLINIVFGFDYAAYDRTIDTYIKNIRHKIEDDPKKPEIIQTVYGQGYKYSRP